MSILCLLGRHKVLTCGVRNGRHEFGRCGRCRCDLLRLGSSWKPVPKGYRVVWRPRTGDTLADSMAGQAAVGRQVTLKNVTIVGERRLDGQRFALVILDQTDERRYVAADRLGTSDTVALAMEKRAAAAIPGILSPLEVTDRAEEPRQHALSG